MSKLKDVNARDPVETFYVLLRQVAHDGCVWATPLVRRLFRFFALPYCYFFLVNWEECTAPRYKVIGHFLYIFFVLRYFPDNYSQCRLWERPVSDWKYYYGSNYDPYQRARLRKKVQPVQYDILYADKWVCHELCRANQLPVPEMIGMVSGGQGSLRELRHLLSSCAFSGRLVAKPVSGKGGHAIKILEMDHAGDLTCVKPDGSDVGDELFPCAHIVQRFLEQHSDLDAFSKSINTVRLVTMLAPGESVVIVGAYVRFGVGHAMIDNLSQGGIAAPIDKETGILKAEAVDRNNHRYKAHPDSGRRFEGFTIPCWPEVLDTVACAQKALRFHRLLGFDIALGSEGPVIIEINAMYDNVDLEQVCGPILKDSDVLKAYGGYSLMINPKQKKLAESLASND